MTRSPGHQQHPEHKVRERLLDDPIRVALGTQIIADSTRVIRVDEDGHPARYYFLRDDIDMTRLQPSSTTTQCPFKGKATYFDLQLRDQRIPDAAWTYEAPYEEHAALQGRVAFYEDHVPGMTIVQSTADRNR